MCNCIDDLNERLKALNKNTMLDIPITWSPEARRVAIMTCKIDDKVRQKPIPVLPTYCPFCGEEYSKENK